MKLHRIQTKQWLPLSPKESWEFFRVPENLNRITPKDMSFQIRSGGGQSTFQGHIICYKIKPLWGITMDWVTEITHEETESYFVDEQRFGPYRFWHHLHRFTPSEGGVLMEDVLHYALPLGKIGDVFGGFVHRKVRGVFSFRELALEQIFPGARLVD